MSDPRISSLDFFFLPCRGRAVLVSVASVPPADRVGVPRSSLLSPTCAIRRLVTMAILTGGI